MMMVVATVMMTILPGWILLTSIDIYWHVYWHLLTLMTIDRLDPVNLFDTLLAFLTRMARSMQALIENQIKSWKEPYRICNGHFSLIPLIESGYWFCLITFHCCDWLVHSVFRAIYLVLSWTWNLTSRTPSKVSTVDISPLNCCPMPKWSCACFRVKFGAELDSGWGWNRQHLRLQLVWHS